MFDVKHNISGSSLTVCKAHGVYFFVRELGLVGIGFPDKVLSKLNKFDKRKGFGGLERSDGYMPMFDMYYKANGEMTVVQYDYCDRSQMAGLNLEEEFGPYECTFTINTLKGVSDEVIRFYSQCIVSVSRNSGNGSVTPIMWYDNKTGTSSLQCEVIRADGLIQYEGINMEMVHKLMRDIETKYAPPVDLETDEGNRLITLSINNSHYCYNRNHKSFDGNIHDIYKLLPAIMNEASYLDFIIGYENVANCMSRVESWDDVYLVGEGATQSTPCVFKYYPCSGEVGDPNPLIRAAKYGSVNNE